MAAQAHRVKPDAARGLASSYACQNCCPDSFYEALSNDCAEPTFVGETSQLLASQRDVSCYGTVYDSYGAGWIVEWFSFNVGVASVGEYDGLAEGEGGGLAFIQASWVTEVWEHEPFATSCKSSFRQVAANALCDVIARRVDNVEPGRGLVGQAVDVTITGSGFGNGTGTPTVDAGSGITVSNVQFISGGEIRARFTIAPNAPGGNHAVSVTTSFGQTSTVAGNFLVQVPTSLMVVSQGVSTTAYPNSLSNGCPATTVPGRNGGLAGPYGMQIRVRYQVLDQAGNPIVATMSLRENLLNFMADGESVGSNQMNVVVTQSGATESNGMFTDEPIGACSPGAFNLASFTQELFMSTNQTLQVRTNNWRLSGRFGCGNMTNGIGVNVSVPCS